MTNGLLIWKVKKMLRGERIGQAQFCSFCCGVGLLYYVFNLTPNQNPINVTCIDFTPLSTFAPFWVYNDMTTRRRYDKGSWLLPLSWVMFLGPALYLFLRPSLSEMRISVGEASLEQE